MQIYSCYNAQITPGITHICYTVICTNLTYVFDDVKMSEGLYSWVRGKLPSYLDVTQQELRDFHIFELTKHYI